MSTSTLPPNKRQVQFERGPCRAATRVTRVLNTIERDHNNGTGQSGYLGLMKWEWDELTMNVKVTCVGINSG